MKTQKPEAKVYDTFAVDGYDSTGHPIIGRGAYGPTGEFRVPRKGELYVTQQHGQDWVCPRVADVNADPDFAEQQWIMREDK